MIQLVQTLQHRQRGQLEQRYVDKVANLKHSNPVMDNAKVMVKPCVAKFQTLLYTLQHFVGSNKCAFHIKSWWEITCPPFHLASHFMAEESVWPHIAQYNNFMPHRYDFHSWTHHFAHLIWTYLAFERKKFSSFIKSFKWMGQKYLYTNRSTFIYKIRRKYKCLNGVLSRKILIMECMARNFGWWMKKTNSQNAKSTSESIYHVLYYYY